MLAERAERDSIGSHEPVELRLALALDARGRSRFPCATWLDAVISSHVSDAVWPPSYSGSTRSGG